MKILDQEFAYDRFQFHQIARSGNIVLLGKRKLNHLHLTYEVVIIQNHPAQTIHGREYPARESMPRSESWGICGWTFATAGAAWNKFHQIIQLGSCGKIGVERGGDSHPPKFSF